MQALKTLKHIAPNLSCVEDYFVAWLMENRVQVPLLYCESFISTANALENLSTQEFAYFNGFPRLQQTAQRLGLTTHQRLQQTPPLVCGNLTLAQTKKEFFKGVGQLPWREDHYIRLQCMPDTGSDKQVQYINSYPLSSGVLLKEDFARVLSGNYLVYSMQSQAASGLEDAYAAQISKMATYKENYTALPTMKTLRDVLLVLKISRQRMTDWFAMQKGHHEISALLETHSTNLARMLVLCERRRIRLGNDAPAEASALHELHNMDKQLSSLAAKIQA